jgi:IS30 family transposase
MDAIVKKGFGKGQHLYQIIKANNLKQSKSAIYNHMKRGWLSADATEFPRMAKFKPRKPKNEVYVPKKAKIGRTYEDFLAFCEQAEITDWVEMDTLIGRVGGKVILTLHFTDANFMIGRLLSNKTAQEVTGKLDYLKGKVDFLELFKVILTDNGSEFADIPGIEKVPNGQIRLFFCDAYKSSQKPHVEKNHTMFRGIAPGGTSFDDWSQETVNLIFSHVNSVSRAMYKGKTSYEMFTFLHSREIAEALEIKEIPALEVIQTPKLLQQLRTKTA